MSVLGFSRANQAITIVIELIRPQTTMSKILGPAPAVFLRWPSTRKLQVNIFKMSVSSVPTSFTVVARRSFWTLASQFPVVFHYALSALLTQIGWTDR